MKKILLPLSACIAFSACCPGRYKCDPGPVVLRFRLYDGRTAKDLVFGSAARYRFAQLRAFTLNGSDTFRVPLGAPANGTDSVCELDLTALPATVYLRLDADDVDTLQLGYEKQEEKCCSGGAYLTSARYNGEEQNPNGTTLTIEK